MTCVAPSQCSQSPSNLSQIVLCRSSLVSQDQYLMSRAANDLSCSDRPPFSGGGCYSIVYGILGRVYKISPDVEQYVCESVAAAQWS